MKSSKTITRCRYGYHKTRNPNAQPASRPAPQYQARQRAHNDNSTRDPISPKVETRGSSVSTPSPPPSCAAPGTPPPPMPSPPPPPPLSTLRPLSDLPPIPPPLLPLPRALLLFAAALGPGDALARPFPFDELLVVAARRGDSLVAEEAPGACIPRNALLLLLFAFVPDGTREAAPAPLPPPPPLPIVCRRLDRGLGAPQGAPPREAASVNSSLRMRVGETASAPPAPPSRTGVLSGGVGTRLRLEGV